MDYILPGILIALFIALLLFLLWLLLSLKKESAKEEDPFSWEDSQENSSSGSRESDGASNTIDEKGKKEWRLRQGVTEIYSDSETDTLLRNDAVNALNEAMTDYLAVEAIKEFDAEMGKQAERVFSITYEVMKIIEKVVGKDRIKEAYFAGKVKEMEDYYRAHAPKEDLASS